MLYHRQQLCCYICAGCHSPIDIVSPSKRIGDKKLLSKSSKLQTSDVQRCSRTTGRMTVLISREVDRDSGLDSDGYIGVFGS